LDVPWWIRRGSVVRMQGCRPTRKADMPPGPVVLGGKCGAGDSRTFPCGALRRSEGRPFLDLWTVGAIAGSESVGIIVGAVAKLRALALARDRGIHRWPVEQSRELCVLGELATKMRWGMLIPHRTVGASPPNNMRWGILISHHIGWCVITC
jgi:hypothetical protein